MNFHIKNLGNNQIEAWVEDFIQEEMDWQVVSEAKCLVAGQQCLIDEIETKPKYTNRGYASKIVNELLNTFEEVAPIGVLPSSQWFWDKFNMKDGLGEERDG